MIIGLYDRWVFRGSRRMWHNVKLEFLGPWDGSEEVFITKYHEEYPNDTIEIYKHKYKPLSKELRKQIEEYMREDPFFVQLNRDERIDKLLS